jgi:hypothetical protein
LAAEIRPKEISRQLDFGNAWPKGKLEKGPENNGAHLDFGNPID